MLSIIAFYMEIVYGMFAGGATPHPVKLVHSPDGLHLTVASAPTSGDRSSDAAAVDDSNPGDSDVMALREPLAAPSGSQMMAAHLFARRQSDAIVNATAYANEALDIPMDVMHAYCNEDRKRERGDEEEELHAMPSFPSAQENNAFGAAQAANNAHDPVATIGTKGGMNMDTCDNHTISPIAANLTAPSASDKAAEVPKRERSSAFAAICGQVCMRASTIRVLLHACTCTVLKMFVTIHAGWRCFG
jgi:hypothetical protein